MNYLFTVLWFTSIRHRSLSLSHTHTHTCIDMVYSPLPSHLPAWWSQWKNRTPLIGFLSLICNIIIVLCIQGDLHPCPRSPSNYKKNKIALLFYFTETYNFIMTYRFVELPIPNILLIVFKYILKVKFSSRCTVVHNSHHNIILF